MKELDLDKINSEFENTSTRDIISWCYEQFDHDSIRLSTSFGAEGMVLVDILVQLVKKPHVFTIDTGRNFQETYDVWQQTIDKYHIPIKTFFPDPKEIEEFNSIYGPNVIYLNSELRKNCCQIRKVTPLKRALEGTKIWITGLRREQNSSRKNLPFIEYNSKYNVYKVYPLLKWDEVTVWEYIRNNGIPYNKLHDQGYPTVGCAPCTRPPRPGEGMRSGRWWWESDEQKECGLHISDGVISRSKDVNYNI